MLMLIIFKSSLTIEGYGQLYSSNGSTSPSFGIRALYNFKEYFGARGGLEYIMHGSGINSIKVPIQILYYPLGYSSQFNPYIGTGLAYYLTFGNNISNSSLGMDIVGGIKFNPKVQNFSLNFEIGYAMPKIGERGALTISGGVGGSLKYDF